VADYFATFQTVSTVEVGDVILYRATDATKFVNVLTVDNTPGSPALTISTGTAVA